MTRPPRTPNVPRLLSALDDAGALLRDIAADDRRELDRMVCLLQVARRHRIEVCA
jgi:hypothetical protein